MTGKKTIGIDARMYGLKHAGIGRYTQNLIDSLIQTDQFKAFNWILFVRQEDQKLLTKKFSPQFRLIEADYSHYSVKEQLLLPNVLKSARCNLIHFPHFNIPLGYRQPFVATIHDLIKHHSRGPETTTRQPLIYQAKFLAYRLVVSQAIQKAQKIFSPSQFVKQQIINQYPKVKKSKIVVTYEGVDNRLENKLTQKEQKKIFSQYRIKSPYLLYVGSLYPHKNIERLIKAVKAVRERNHKISLVIVCSRNVFWQRTKEKVNQEKAQNFINLTGFVPDKDLAGLYQNAEAFVFPSLMEGFGLPGLEAMSLKCPVVSSSAGPLPEIYGSAALFFNPKNIEEMAEKIIKMTSSQKLQDQYRARGLERVKRYSWQKCAQETIKEYQKIIV